MLKNLPNFITRKVEMIKASQMLYKSLYKNAERLMGVGYGKSETFIRLTDCKKGIHVGFESCPVHDWGITYSLGGYKKSFNAFENIQDWYLEVYWGFDVMFFPISSEFPTNTKDFPKLDEKLLGGL